MIDLLPVEPEPSHARAFQAFAPRMEDIASLVEAFRSAILDEGMTRHRCVLEGACGAEHVLHDDDRLAGTGVRSLWQKTLWCRVGGGAHVAVTIAGAPIGVPGVRYARLHAMAMVYAERIHQLTTSASPAKLGTPLPSGRASRAGSGSVTSLRA